MTVVMAHAGTSQEFAEEVSGALHDLRDVILEKDLPGLRRIHAEDFLATELHGQRMDAATHIEACMEASDLELEYIEIVVRDLGGDLGIAWGTQTLKGFVRPEDLGAGLGDAILEGIVFAFTFLWRRSDAGWQMLGYHMSTITPEEES